MWDHVGCVGLGDVWRYTAASVANRTATAEIQIQRSRPRWGVAPDTGLPTCDPLSAIQFNSHTRSLALCQRSSGSLARHFLTTRSSAGGVIGCSVAIGGGSAVRMAAIRLARLFPSNGGLPV